MTAVVFRRGVRAAITVFAALFVAAAAGWIPVFPVVAGAIVTLLMFAGETWITLAGRPATARPETPAQEALVDTSALIDGRLRDVAASGFMQLDLIVPEFVLSELQHVADSPDPSRRARGRRGLDVLSAMRAAERVSIRVIADDAPEEAAVDMKLVAVAVRRGAVLVTTDFALNKIAAIRGVAVLNVNELAHALRPAVLPGERLRVAIVKDGKEPGQGVAYLDDGTMIVVEQGRGLAGRTIDVVVTSAIQTAAGKMFFARLDS
jgi:uncharacterized protein YacL